MPLLAKRAEDRFFAMVQKTESCWIYTGAKQQGGYGTFGIGTRKANKKSVLAHRFSYELAIGPLPPKSSGMQLDHICRNRVCVNPSHLQLVAARVNTLRSPIAPASVNARKTHCKHGHPLEGVNLTVLANGDRSCRTCRNAIAERSRRRQGYNPRPAIRTRCQKGHPWIPENIAVLSNGKNTCKICLRVKDKRYREKRALKVA